jgi:hypothetical protein
MNWMHRGFQTTSAREGGGVEIFPTRAIRAGPEIPLAILKEIVGSEAVAEEVETSIDRFNEIKFTARSMASTASRTRSRARSRTQLVQSRRKREHTYPYHRRVRILHFPNLPDKRDVVDCLEAGGDAEEFARLVDSAPDYVSNEATGPQSLMRPLPLLNRSRLHSGSRYRWLRQGDTALH